MYSPEEARQGSRVVEAVDRTSAGAVAAAVESPARRPEATVAAVGILAPVDLPVTPAEEAATPAEAAVEMGAVSRETTPVADAAMRVAVVEATPAVVAAAMAGTNRARILPADAALVAAVGMQVQAAAIRAVTKTIRAAEGAVAEVAAPLSTE